VTLSLLVVVGFLGLIYWFLAGRPHLGSRHGDRVYLRRRPGVRSLVAGAAGLLIVGSRVGAVEHLLLFGTLLLAALISLVVAASIVARRTRR
jgi:hypothetical protein